MINITCWKFSYCAVSERPKYDIPNTCAVRLRYQDCEQTLESKLVPESQLHSVTPDLNMYVGPENQRNCDSCLISERPSSALRLTREKIWVKSRTK